MMPMLAVVVTEFVHEHSFKLPEVGGEVFVVGYVLEGELQKLLAGVAQDIAEER